jgi:hypothetical protein
LIQILCINAARPADAELGIANALRVNRDRAVPDAEMNEIAR